MWAEILPFVLAASLGFMHSFETDHLVAVSNIVTKRNSVILAMKDGTFWGLGHSSSILIIGLAMLLLRWAIPQHYFQPMEGAVGVMIIGLGIFRLLILSIFLLVFVISFSRLSMTLFYQMRE